MTSQHRCLIEESSLSNGKWYTLKNVFDGFLLPLKLDSNREEREKWKHCLYPSFSEIKFISEKWAGIAARVQGKRVVV